MYLKNIGFISRCFFTVLLLSGSMHGYYAGFSEIKKRSNLPHRKGLLSIAIIPRGRAPAHQGDDVVMPEAQTNRMVVTVLGKDTMGIIAGITGTISDYQGNVMEISQTVIDGFFTMIMVVDLEHCTTSLVDLRDRLQARGDELGVKVTAQHENIFRQMHRI
jgi:ACT domain-containing protein